MEGPAALSGARVIESVVARGMCIGCGLCVGVCPRPESNMRMAESGLWEPRLNATECPAACGRCGAVCPFGSGDGTEPTLPARLFEGPDVEFDAAVGHVRACYAGAHPDESARLQAASGGVVTRILEHALEAGAVEQVGCVGPWRPASQDVGYQLVETTAAVRAASSTKYFPVHLADAVRSVLRSRRATALVALPCQAKALRLACEQDARLDESLVAIITLTCGQMKTAHYTRELARGRLGTSELADVGYRHKALAGGARDYEYRLTARTSQGSHAATIAASDTAKLWESRWNGAYPCCFCDDVFGEYGDVSVMDAFVEPYLADGRGTSLVVVRSETAGRLVAPLVSEGALRDVSIEMVRASQSGGILDKRRGLATRLRVASALRLPSLPAREGATPVGFAQRLHWVGAYLRAASNRSRETRGRAWVFRAASRVLIAWGMMVSRVMLAIRRSGGAGA